MPREAFDKSKRLLTQQVFQKVFDKASYRVADRHFLILACPNLSGHARLGLVIGKKNIRLSVHRNRIKRVARETFRHHQHSFAGIDIIFLARRGLDKVPKSAFSSTLSQAWVQLALNTK
ncbi:MAG: ribonuclease P protein component [Gammaproteobacteria bacterium]|nr:MAG: ribonuclease P protein component [Gammaproteobacteria bacterium]